MRSSVAKKLPLEPESVDLGQRDTHGNFDEIFVEQLEACLPKLRRKAFILCKSNSLADDLVQIACLKAWKSRSSYDPNKPFMSWMVRILKNSMIDEYRSTQRRAEIITTVNVEDLQPKTPDPTGTQNEMMDLVRALNNLGDKERKILVMRLIVGLSYDQIGAELGITIANARKTLSRARKALQTECGSMPS